MVEDCMVKIDVPLSKAINYWPPLTVVLVSTIGANMVPRVAPYGLNMLSYGEMPVMLLAMNKERGTLANIKSTGDFVVNIAGDNMVAEVNSTADKAEPGTNKFERAHLTPIRSVRVKSPSVKECQVHYECSLIKVEDYGDKSIVFGKVVAVRANNELAQKRIDELKEASKPLYYGRVLDGPSKFYALGKYVGERRETSPPVPEQTKR